VNNSTVINVVNAQISQAHMMLVVVNSSVSGGGVATFSTAPSASDIGIHETGHTAFGFADEYDYWSDCSQAGHDHFTGGEPWQPNAAINTSRPTLKCGGLVARFTALPTMTNPDCTKRDGRASTVPTNGPNTIARCGSSHNFSAGLPSGHQAELESLRDLLLERDLRCPHHRCRGDRALVALVAGLFAIRSDRSGTG